MEIVFYVCLRKVVNKLWNGYLIRLIKNYSVEEYLIIWGNVNDIIVGEKYILSRVIKVGLFYDFNFIFKFVFIFCIYDIKSVGIYIILLVIFYSWKIIKNFYFFFYSLVFNYFILNMIFIIKNIIIFFKVC